MEVSEEDAPPAKPGRARRSAKSGKPGEGKAKGRAARSAPPTELVVELNGTGMTPLLRAGAGGLAAALRALALEADPRASWPVPVAIADGTAIVEPFRVVLRFGPNGPEPFLNELFARVFRLTPEGVVCPMGTFEPSSPPTLGLAIALQLGMKRTFLQHGSSRTRAGAARAVQVEIDERMFQYMLEPYAEYVHREGAASILDAIKSGHVGLSGWAYPGAAQRHVGFAESRCEYGAAEALSAMFALIGCLSYPAARGGSGVLVVPVLAAMQARAGATASGSGSLSLRKLVPGFVFAFVGLAALRSLGDVFGASSPAFVEHLWQPALALAAQLSELLLIVGMAGVGLNVELRDLRHVGWQPLAAGLIAALLLATTSLALISALL